MAGLAAFHLGTAAPALALSCNKGERVDSLQGFDSTANGARAKWVLRRGTAPYYWANGDHVNQTIWIGANGQKPADHLGGSGRTSGSQNGDLQNHWTYYTARGINYPNSYAAVNLYGDLTTGVTHSFDAFYSGTSFQVEVDDAARYYWASVTGPTIEYDVGFEAICATSDGASVDVLARTYVSKMQSHRQSDSQWIQSDHGSFELFGTGSGSGVAWCSEPFTFRYWLNFTGDTTKCGP